MRLEPMMSSSDPKSPLKILRATLDYTLRATDYPKLDGTRSQPHEMPAVLTSSPTTTPMFVSSFKSRRSPDATPCRLVCLLRTSEAIFGSSSFSIHLKTQY